jgi:hypothetical protein
MAFGGRTAIGGRVPFGAARRAFPLRTAAAAAVLFGLVVAWTRLSPAPPTSVAPDLSASQLHPSPALSAPTDSAPVAGQSPVAVQSVGLRHLQPGEHLLRDSAQFFDPILSEDGTAGGRSRYEGSPVGLERRLTVPPR